jgi:hypothetical protein
VSDNGAAETPQLTWNDVYEHSRVIYERLRKHTQRALAHHIAWDLAVKADCYGQKDVVEETLKHIKSLESHARSERRWDSFDRATKEFEKLKANGWRKPRKKRRRKADEKTSHV